MRKIISISMVSLISLAAWGQSDLAFYHLGAVTPQSSMNNASFFPEAKFYFSLPGLSGLNVKANSGFSYNQLMTPVEGTDSVQVDLVKLLDQLKAGDNLRLKGDVPLFLFGIRVGDQTFSLFTNVRYSGGATYPVNFLDYFVNGNGNLAGEVVEENLLKGGGIAYSEIGLGYSREIYVLGDRKLQVGARLKYLQGIAHASTAKDASISMYTDPDTYDLRVQFNNATVRTVGLTMLESDEAASYAIGFGNNQNKGFGIDLGGSLEINEKLVGYVSFNDFGNIKWKQDIENYTLTSEEVTLGGFDNIDDIDVGQALEDSLEVWTESTTSSDAFKSPIGGRIMLGATYQVLEKGHVSGTLVRSGSSYQAKEIGYGVGYTHQFGKTLTLSTTIMKEQYRPVKMGGAFAVRLGAFQLYASSDDMLNVVRDPAKTQGMDLRFGINFLIGRSNAVQREPRKKAPKEELSPFPPEYDLDHLLDDGDQEN